MKLGFENRRQAIIAGILVPVALGAVIYFVMQQFSAGSAPAPKPAANVSETSQAMTEMDATPAAKAAARNSETQRNFAASGEVAETSEYDPTLHPEVMFAAEHLEYTGTGRNIFSAMSAPVVVNIPKPIAPARNFAPVVVKPAGPPSPPPIPLAMIGVETHANGSRQVFLKHGDDIFMAGVGDIVMRQYKVTKIGANNVEIEDLPYNDKQTFVMQAQ